jgi:hypothetical protein
MTNDRAGRPGCGIGPGAADRRWHVWERAAGRDAVESVANRGPHPPAGEGWRFVRVFGAGCPIVRPGLRRVA